MRKMFNMLFMSGYKVLAYGQSQRPLMIGNAEAYNCQIMMSYCQIDLAQTFPLHTYFLLHAKSKK